jgi:inhibitor of KinA sporulation pathway (predicted exonuclease)
MVSTDTVWMSWGNYDHKQLTRDAQRHGIAMPLTMPHQNAKRLFAKAQRIGKEVGMVRACALAASAGGAASSWTGRCSQYRQADAWVLGHATLSGQSQASAVV